MPENGNLNAEAFKDILGNSVLPGTLWQKFKNGSPMCLRHTWCHERARGDFAFQLWFLLPQFKFYVPYREIAKTAKKYWLRYKFHGDEGNEEE